MTERGNPMTLFRCLPLALVAFAFHAQAQSLSPAYDAFRKKETPAPAPAQPATPVQTDAAPPAPAPAAEEEERPRGPVVGRGPVRRAPEPAKPSRNVRDDQRRQGKLTINRALGDEDGARSRSVAAMRRAHEN